MYNDHMLVSVVLFASLLAQGCNMYKAMYTLV